MVRGRRKGGFSSGARVIGVDAAPSLIDAARERAEGDHRQQYLLGDARKVAEVLAPIVKPGEADAALIILAAQDLDPLEPVLNQLVKQLKVGGRVVLVMTHPCFRPPRESDWGQMADGRWCRQVAAYASEQHHAIHTGAQQQSHHFHRPLSYYLNCLSSAGLSFVANRRDFAAMAWQCWFRPGRS